MKYILILIVVYTSILVSIYYICKTKPISIEGFGIGVKIDTPKPIKYAYKGYSSLLKDYNSKKIKYTSSGIPKIIYKTSWQKRNNFPKEMVNVLNNTIIMNPDYYLYYFDDDEVDTFMKSYSSSAYNAYTKLVPGAFKADLFRYCILEQYGGCYSDIGHITYKTFDQICENSKLVLVKDLHETGIHNALMCCIPHHPFIKKLLDLCIKNIESNYYGYSALSITGPILVGTVFYKFFYTTFDTLNIFTDDSFEKENNKVMFNKYITPGSDNGIKILKLEAIGEVDDSTNSNMYITDINNNILIKTKFDNYYKIMYVNKQYYNDYWLNKKVYNHNN